MKKVYYHSAVYTLLFLTILLCLFGGKYYNIANRKDTLIAQSNIYNCDSILMSAMPLDSINGIIYITNVGCSKCIADLLSYIKEISDKTINESLYLASSDTFLLRYIINTEYSYSDMIKEKFQLLPLKDKLLGVKYSGLIIRYIDQKFLIYNKYQPGKLEDLFNY